MARKKDRDRTRMREQFGSKCQRCGYKKCLRALQFHHKDDAEKKDWSGTHGGAHPSEVEAHPERFELLCANCHIEEHERLDTERYVFKTCEVCAVQFRVTPYLLESGRRKYCSYACRDKSRATAAQRTTAKRLLKHTEKTEGCWNWTGSFCEKSQCGMLAVRRADALHYQRTPAHRVSYEVHVGPIPAGRFVFRRCQNPRCVNPEHLYVGDFQELADRNVVRKTRPCGEASANAKLTEEDVRAIRHLAATRQMTHRQIAEKFSISVGTISNVTARRIWKHVL